MPALVCKCLVRAACQFGNARLVVFASSSFVCVGARQASDGVRLECEEFTCSQEQMLDLLASVRDATKQVDRILASE